MAYISEEMRRIVNDLLKSNAGLDYIRYYLIDTFQVGDEDIDKLFKELDVIDPADPEAYSKQQAKKKQQRRAEQFGM